MPQITTRTTSNNTLLYVSVCDYCGKEFAYPYQAQTENNILSHMKYCKYKTRNAPQPTIEIVKEESMSQNAIEYQLREQLRNAENCINDMWTILQTAFEEETEDESDYYEPLPYPTQQQKPLTKAEEKELKKAEEIYTKLCI